MPAYRVYEIDEGGRVCGVPVRVDAENDTHVLALAQALRGFRALEIWEGSRRVAWLKSKRD